MGAVAIVVVKDVVADASHEVDGVLYEQIELPVVVVINPKSALSIVAREFESCSVADVIKCAVSVAFIKYIPGQFSLMGAPLKGRFDNNEIQIAIPIVISKGEAKPGP